MSDEEEKIEETLRQVVINIPDKKIIDLKIRLQYESIPMNTFFRILIDSFLDNDDHILELIQEWRSEVGKNKVNKYIKKMIEKRKDTERNFSLTKEEIAKIYDKAAIGTEFDDLLGRDDD